MTTPSIDILAHLPLGIMIADARGRAIWINESGKALLEACGGVIQFAPETGKAEYRLEKNGQIIEVGVFSSDGNTIYYLKDVTKSAHAEAMAKPEGKYPDIKGMAADIAHEIRNPLGSIELYASLLKRGMKKEKDIRRIDQIICAVKAVNARISNLLLAGKAWEASLVDLNVHDILKDILLHSEEAMERDMIFLSLKMADARPVIEGDRDMLRQIFLSLILTALQSLPESSRLEIETLHIPEPPLIEVHFRAAGGDFLERISGTETNAGIGLAIIHHIMSMHRATVRITQNTRDCTSLVLSFPLLNVAKYLDLQEDHEKTTHPCGG